VFADPLAVTIYDPVHSDEEDRYIALGESQRQRLLVVVFTDRDDRIGSSVRGSRPAERGKTMKKAVKKTSAPDMLDEYDFSKGVRGKYAKRYAEGTNIVVLAPDVAEFFPDSESVNTALRALVGVARKNVRKAAV
jgi:hypothetical protein